MLYFFIELHLYFKEIGLIMTTRTYFKLQHLLFRFMRSFDEKDWLTMNDCLAKTIYCDYSSFRNVKPGRVSNSTFVKQRIERLKNLKTQHNVSNVEIGSSTNFGLIQCNYTIYRFGQKFNGSKKNYFHSYGHYTFKCKYEKNEWLIFEIVQTLLVNDGNPEIYGADLAKKK